MSVLNDTIVVGAGLAGLFYAWQFAKATRSDQKLILLEQQPRVGGRVLSLPVSEGKFLELGPARFSDQHVVLQSLLQELHIPFREYKSSPVLTFQQPFQLPLHLEKQIRSSYPLSPADVIRLQKCQWNLWNLLLTTVSDSTDSTESDSLLSFVVKQLGPTLAQACQDSTSSEAFWHSPVSEARHILDEMFASERKWFSSQVPLETLPQRLLYQLLKEYPNKVVCHLGCEVIDIIQDDISQDDTKTFQVFAKDARQKVCSFHATQLVLALDLPALHKVKSNLPLPLAPFRSFPLLRLFARYPLDSHQRSWYQPDSFPVLYTGTKLKMVIPSSAPGWMQVSYTDGQDTKIWLTAIKQSSPEVIGPNTWKITKTDSPLIQGTQKALLSLLPRAQIPTPLFMIAHLCHVMYPVQSQGQGSLQGLPPKSKNWVVIGEGVTLHNEVGITSAWMESALRSALKGFHHLQGKSHIQPIDLSKIDLSKK